LNRSDKFFIFKKLSVCGFISKNFETIKPIEKNKININYQLKIKSINIIIKTTKIIIANIENIACSNSILNK